MQHLNTQSEFRSDINGLRALAVAAVILYHFGVPGFAGGFIGVDIFFVISGFLMTGIVVKKLEQGTFSLIDFYLARAKRIVPALAVLCAVLVIAGWFVLLPPDYKSLSSHALYSLSFLSNVEYWQEAGYFDVASHEKWLLHTWSLSVEWQFYLLLPIVLWITWRVKPGRNAQQWTIIVGMLLSLAACIVMTNSDATTAFFLLHYRAWEMLGGGLVFLLTGQVTLSARFRRFLEIGGLLMIATANIVFSKNSAWPGTGAILPVAATMMVLMAKRVSPWTRSRTIQWLGDRSYSLYLWHWPIYVGLIYVELGSDPLALAGGLIVTLILGHISYVLVENPSRQQLSKVDTQYASALVLLIFIMAMAPAGFVWSQQGVGGRFPATVESVAAEAKNINVRRAECHLLIGTDSPACRYGTGSQQVLVLGDSHAAAIVTSVASAMSNSDAAVIQLTYSGCPFVLGMRFPPANLLRQRADYRCSDFIEKMNVELTRKYGAAPVVVANRYGSSAFGTDGAQEEHEAPEVYFSKVYPQPTKKFLNEFSSAITGTACELAKYRPVYLMRPVPEMGRDIPKTLSRRMNFGRTEDLSISVAAYKSRNDWVWAAQDTARDTCGVKILDPMPYLCINERCYGSRNGHPLYSDDDHLSEHGNKLLVPMFKEVLKDLRAP